MYTASINQSYCKGNTQPVSLWHLLFEGRGANPARPVLIAALGLDAASADFLAACIYWRLKMSEPFYKFNAPCAHSLYRAGDSWLEELGMSEHTFYRARGAVATKNTMGHELAETMKSTATSTLIVYWTDSQRVTWYDVRLELLADKLGEAMGIEIALESTEVGDGTMPPMTTLAARDERHESVSPTDNPAPNSGNSGLLMKPQNSWVTYLHTDKEEEKEEIEKEGLSTEGRHLAAELQKRGVYAEPAQDLAWIALAKGLTVSDAIAAFEAHYRALARYRRGEEIVAMSVARLRKQGFRKARKRTAHWPSYSVTQEGGPRDSNRRAGESTQAVNSDEARPASLATRQHVMSRVPPPPPSPLAAQWQAMQRELELSLSRPVYDQHLRGARLVELIDGGCTIAVRNDASLAWLENQLKARVASVLSYQLGRPIQPTFVCEGG